MFFTHFCLFSAIASTYGYPEAHSCDEVVQKVADTDRLTQILNPPPIIGYWVSERCETRSGPEYVLRKQLYVENGTYIQIEHLYADEDCSRPLMSRQAKGKCGVRGKSLLTQGGSQVELALEIASIILHSVKMVDILSHKANSSCRDAIQEKWLRNIEYTVYKREERNISREVKPDELEMELACMRSVGMDHEEVGFMRVQSRPPGPPERTAWRHELIVGETRGKGTIFQDPLVRVNQTAECEICSKVYSSTLGGPAVLRPRKALPLHLTGEWVSTRCEVRPMGLFLRRRFRVSGRSWHAEFRFFSDPTCVTPSLLAAAEGKYALAEKSTGRVPGAVDFNFDLERAFLTLFEKGLVESLQNDGNCGPPGVWQVGVARDLTPAGGCPALGIVVPTTEYELVRLEPDQYGNVLLLLGQSEERKVGLKERPTSFQPPLLQCASPEFPLTHFLNSYNNGVTSHIRFPLIVAILLNLCLM
ncbi:protein APCDD1-like isoform X2 [Rhodnius prolixus]|uniref:protein APCDD1-like isoform X2 n=1 Tax=Rhodnius prolixus TaxID=13249 RepID=UPI003D189369